ncbi:MAG TPA: SIMPL domain-containing protein [Lachnoclostridium sp.]|jgi:uncharacterized protein YggE|uniref:SIMPL domain-containing protein n=1 Tax=Lacrimispora sp. TaxID=2719234 RepID=UPI000EDF51F6|nr:SIMPL domain-containing protein [Lacrimispora sp.]HCD46726.1 SIMPL domain-containing protein [Lachnoclostridium sp.]
MRKMNKPLAAALVAATVLSMTACAQTGTASVPGTNVTTISNKETNTIQVSSTEGLKVVPDMAQVNFAVLTQAGDPKTCQEKNSGDTSSVIAFLKNSGIDEKSIQTSSYGLEPIYDWSNSTQQITGYQMRTSITLSDLPLDQVSAILSSSVDAGINCIDSVNYLSSKYDENYREALKKAVDAAKVKAEAIAAASGVTLDGIAHIEELNTYPNIRYSSTVAKEDAAAGAKSVVVEPGQIGVEAQVTVTFRVK